MGCSRDQNIKLVLRTHDHNNTIVYMNNVKVVWFRNNFPDFVILGICSNETKNDLVTLVVILFVYIKMRILCINKYYSQNTIPCYQVIRTTLPF